MAVRGKDTENASENELNDLDELSKLFEEWPITNKEKLVHLSLWMRRQELTSVVIASYEIFKLIQNVKGSIMYFGIYHGAGMMTYANLCSGLEPFNHSREIIGFDTFSGYPQITEDDITHEKSFATLVKGGFASDSYDMLQKLIKIYDRNRPLNHVPKIKIIKGNVVETLPQYLSKNQHTIVSLVVLTMNLYEPTKLVLNLLWPRMPKGAVVEIHSMNQIFYPGATKAVLDSVGIDVPIRTFPYAPNLAYIIK